MIYSEWQPDGDYEYFATDERHGIGDDLPDINMPPPINGIGVPSQDVGRAIPAFAKSQGFGEFPVGVMAPMVRGKVFGISGTSISFDKPLFICAAVGTVLGAGIYFYFRGKK